MSKFNVGDRVTITYSNLPEYVGKVATVTDPKGLDQLEETVLIELDDKSVLGPWVSLYNGSVPWEEEWLSKVS